jgi:hypothetical protein
MKYNKKKDWKSTIPKQDNYHMSSKIWSYLSQIFSDFLLLCIDWLVVLFLTPIGQYCTHIDTKFSNI